MRTETTRRILEEMNNQPWYIRFRRWLRRKIYTWMCLIFNK